MKKKLLSFLTVAIKAHRTLTILLIVFTISIEAQTDECAGIVTPLTVNADLNCGVTTAGTTVGATGSAQPTGLFLTPNNDVWFSFVATATSHVVEVLNVVNTGTGTNTTLTTTLFEVYDLNGDCNNLLSVGFSSADAVTSNPLNAAGLVPGNTYIIRVFGALTGADRNDISFDVCVGTEPPCTTPNAPNGPLNLTPSTTIINGTFGAAAPAADNYLVIVSTSNTAPTIVDGTTYTGTFNQAGNDYIVVDDDNDTTFSATGLVPSTQYYFYIYSFNNTACTGGPVYSTALNGNDTTLASIAGDVCATAIALPNPSLTGCTYISADNIGATDSGAGNPGCASYSTGDVWFSVEVPASGQVDIDTQAGTITDSGMAVYSGTCGALTLLDCDDDGGNLSMSFISITGRTPGEVLFIRVWDWFDGAGTFGICTTTVIPPGNNGVTICEFEASEPMTSDLSCTSGGQYIAGDDDSGTTALEPAVTANLLAGVNYTLVTTVWAGGNTTASGAFNWSITGGTINGGATDIAGVLTAGTDPIAPRPATLIISSDPCDFAAATSNYVEFTFTVDADGVYTFEMDNNPIDLMGYIYTGAFTPGTCQTDIPLEWYADPTGGTALATGNVFDPVGVDPALPDTSTAGTYDYYVECPSNPGVRIQIDYVINSCCTTWTAGAGSNDWTNPLNWSGNAVPTITDCVVIPATANNPVILNNDDGVALDLTILNGATLTQQTNSTLTIENFVNVETGGTYTMEDSSSLIQVNDVANTIDGTFTMARIANMRRNDYVFWSSPVTNFSIQNVSAGTPDGFKYRWLPFVTRPPGPPGPLDFGEWEAYNTGLMDVGRGYIIRGPNGHPAIPSPFTANFTGTPNNGDILQPIERSTFTGADYQYQPYVPGDLLTVTSDDDNWNLVGNPYPSAINAIDFLSLPANSNIEGFVYLWTHDTDINAVNPDPFYDDYVFNYNPADYIAYNASGVSNPVGFLGNIGAGQGFFVLMNDLATTTETITFNNSMRNSSYANDQFYRTSETESNSQNAVHRIWIDYIEPNESTNTALVAYLEGATNNHDRMFDAKITKGNGLNIYTLINEDAYIIQGRALPFDEMDTIPIGLNISQPGLQTIAINTLEGVFLDDNSQIYIEDLYNGSIHNLKNTPYFFNSDEGIFNDRLVLRFNAESLGLDNPNMSSGVVVFEQDDKINIESMTQTISSIIVYDVLGRTLFAGSNINQNSYSIDGLSPNTQVLMVKIFLLDGTEHSVKLIF